jgi:hypothetical protein
MADDVFMNAARCPPEPKPSNKQEKDNYEEDIDMDVNKTELQQEIKAKVSTPKSYAHLTSTNAAAGSPSINDNYKNTNETNYIKPIEPFTLSSTNAPRSGHQFRRDTNSTGYVHPTRSSTTTSTGEDPTTPTTPYTSNTSTSHLRIPHPRWTLQM